jgi:hypothetical protein
VTRSQGFLSRPNKNPRSLTRLGFSFFGVSVLPIRCLDCRVYLLEHAGYAEQARPLHVGAESTRHFAPLDRPERDATWKLRISDVVRVVA